MDKQVQVQSESQIELVYGLAINKKDLAGCDTTHGVVKTPQGDLSVPLCGMRGSKEYLRTELMKHLDDCIECLDLKEGELLPDKCGR